MNIDSRKTHFRLQYLYALPQVDWNAATVRKKADPYQPTSERELNSSVILGMAVATMVMSSATRKIVRATPARMRTSCPACGYKEDSTRWRSTPSC